jgi:hypothetical protein
VFGGYITALVVDFFYLNSPSQYPLPQPDYFVDP